MNERTKFHFPTGTVFETKQHVSQGDEFIATFKCAVDEDFIGKTLRISR